MQYKHQSKLLVPHTTNKTKNIKKKAFKRSISLLKLMAKSKFLLLLTRRSSRLLSSSSSKKDTAATSPASSKSDITKSQEMIILLNNFPESESESDRELSFSFLLDKSSPEKNDNLEKGGNTEDQCKEATAVKEKKKRRISRSSCGSGRNGVLLNFHVPSYFTDYSRSRSSRETPCTTLADLEKREMEFNRVGCWRPLLRRKQDHNKSQLEAMPQLTY